MDLLSLPALLALSLFGNEVAFALPTLAILVPAAGGLIAMAMITRRAAWVASIVTFGLQVALLVTGVYAIEGNGPRWLVADPAPRTWFELWNVRYDVHFDYVALGLIALTTLVTFCASAMAWYADRERPAPLQGLLWLTAAGLCGLFVARDLVVFYVFFELMLIPLLFAVGGWGGEYRVRAALTMFIYTLVGSLLMLVGVLAVGIQGGSFDLAELGRAAQDGSLELPGWALATFVLAFAIKAPLFPFHGWLPLAYRQSLPEVTALLSGVVSKAAMFGFLVVVLPLFPQAMSGWFGTALVWWCLASLLYGSIVAFRQPDARGVVAYSSLAQMGLILLGLAVYLGDGGAQALAGSYMQTINHGLISAALFLLIGLVELRVGTSVFARLGGLATGRPVLATIMLVVTLCALAVPGSNAFAGELLILAGAFRAAWEHAWVYAAVGSLAIVLAAMYALRMLSAVMHTEHSHTGADSAPVRDAFGPDMRRGELLAVAPLVAAILLLSVWPNALRRAMDERPVELPSRVEQQPDLVAAGTGHGAASAEGEH